MPNMDEHGNKVGEIQRKKSIVSRELRAFRVRNNSYKHCAVCGYKVRGSSHESGGHHNGVS